MPTTGRGLVKVSCDNCGSKYSLPEARLKGRVLKIRCKSCNSVFEVRDRAAGQSSALASRGQKRWFAVIGRDRVGPLTAQEVRDRHQRRELNLRSYVWRQGMSEWRRLFEVEEFDDLKEHELAENVESIPVRQATMRLVRLGGAEPTSKSPTGPKTGGAAARSELADGGQGGLIPEATRVVAYLGKDAQGDTPVRAVYVAGQAGGQGDTIPAPTALVDGLTAQSTVEYPHSFTPSGAAAGDDEDDEKTTRTDAAGAARLRAAIESAQVGTTEPVSGPSLSPPAGGRPGGGQDSLTSVDPDAEQRLAGGIAGAPDGTGPHAVQSLAAPSGRAPSGRASDGMAPDGMAPDGTGPHQQVAPATTDDDTMQSLAAFADEVLGDGLPLPGEPPVAALEHPGGDALSETPTVGAAVASVAAPAGQVEVLVPPDDLFSDAQAGDTTEAAANVAEAARDTVEDAPMDPPGADAAAQGVALPRRMAGQRHEDSVLFSLDNLSRDQQAILASDPAAEEAAASAAAAGDSSLDVVSEDAAVAAGPREAPPASAILAPPAAPEKRGGGGLRFVGGLLLGAALLAGIFYLVNPRLFKALLGLGEPTTTVKPGTATAGTATAGTATAAVHADASQIAAASRPDSGAASTLDAGQANAGKANAGKADAGKAVAEPDSGKPDPVKPDPKKPDPKKPDPVKPDPKKPDPKKPDPVKPDPKKPVRPRKPRKPRPIRVVTPDPVKPDPKKPDPVKPDPKKPDPKKPDPVKPDPVKPDPKKPDPVKPDPAKPALAEKLTRAQIRNGVRRTAGPIKKACEKQNPSGFLTIEAVITGATGRVQRAKVLGTFVEPALAACAAKTFKAVARFPRFSSATMTVKSPLVLR